MFEPTQDLSFNEIFSEVKASKLKESFDEVFWLKETKQLKKHSREVTVSRSITIGAKILSAF